MNRSEFRQSTIEYYCDASSVCKEGQEKHILRCEDANHPANQVDCSGAKVYIGQLKNANCSEFRKFVVFIDIGREDGEVAEIGSDKTRKECTEALSFGMVYSQFFPSTFYRAFRELRGYDKSSPLQTNEQIEEEQNRGLMALACLAGAAVSA
jgi:hypothetical protein